jgi:parallel beta-helix repeat protein
MSLNFKSTRPHVSTLIPAVAILVFAAAGSFASAATLCVNPGGKSGCKSTIGAAIAAAAAGDVVQVAKGTYKEQVTITKPISLVASPRVFDRPVIDATGLPNGILVSGMATAPSPGVWNVIVSGFEVRNANFEGILVVNASNVTLLDNHVLNNNNSLLPGTGVCTGIPAFETNEGDDCGEGIHLMAVDHSTLSRNLVENNSGGILISDETGPTSNNLIKGNIVRYNGWDCGITLASHGPATSLIPSAHLPFGISRNVISDNDSHHNGLLAPGAGAGVGIFAPFPGTTNTANVVIHNDLHDNGLPGVTMHNHAFAPAPAPGVNLNDNAIIGNTIHGNAADTADAFTPGSTGINIYSVAPIWGTVIAQNYFTDQAINIAFKAPVGNLIVHLNDFEDRGIGIDNLGSGTIDATQNWWNCGPPSATCSSVVGSGITTAPWLNAPYRSTPDAF